TPAILRRPAAPPSAPERTGSETRPPSPCAFMITPPSIGHLSRTDETTGRLKSSPRPTRRPLATGENTSRAGVRADPSCPRSRRRPPMPPPTVPSRSRRVRCARCPSLVADLAILPAHRPARGEDPPPEGRRPAGRIFVRALYCGTEPGVKPAGIIALDPDTAQTEITYPVTTPGDPSPDGRFVAYGLSGGNRPKERVGTWIFDAGGEG